MPSNPDVYPETAAFEQKMGPLVAPFAGAKPQSAILRMYSVMRSNIGEYEHGSVDIEAVIGNWSDNHRDSVHIYRSVCEDVLLSYIAVYGRGL